MGGEGLDMIAVFARYGDTFGTVNFGADFEINTPIEIFKCPNPSGL